MNLREALFNGWSGCSNGDCVVRDNSKGMHTNANCKCVVEANRSQLCILQSRLNRLIREEAMQAKAQPAPDVEPHPDDAAVDNFAAAMKEKLAQARDKGRSGWERMTRDELSAMLHEHVNKGDPRDVANFCMFLWSLRQPITPCTAPDVREPVKPAGESDMVIYNSMAKNYNKSESPDVAELVHHLAAAHAFIEHTEAFGYAAKSGILQCGDAQWDIDASKAALVIHGGV